MPAKGTTRPKAPGTPYVKTEKGYPYYYVTYEKGKRKTLHRLVYEACFGSLPQGHVIRFRDGNTLNCDPLNLYSDTRAAFANENRNPQTCYQALRTFNQTAEGKRVRAGKAVTMRHLWQAGLFPVEQRKATVEQRTAAGLIKPGQQTITARSAAYWLYPHDRQMAAFVLAEVPELVNVRLALHHLSKQIRQTKS